MYDFTISMAPYFWQDQYHITLGFLHLFSILLFSTAAAPSPLAARLWSKFSTATGVLSNPNPNDMAAAANVRLRLRLRLRHRDELMINGDEHMIHGDEPMMDIMAWNRQRREAVDAEMLDYAMRRLRQEGRDAKTGQTYEVRLPGWTAPPLRGGPGPVKSCQVMRAEPGSLRRRGLLFNSFTIAQGTQVHQQALVPQVQQQKQQFLLLIYRSLDNHLALDSNFYRLPPGYTFISPIFGIIGYTYSQLHLLNTTSRSTDSSSAVLTKVELSSTSMTTVAITPTNSFNLTTSSFNLTSSGSPPPYNARPPDVTPLCAFFLPNGSFYFSNLSHPPNICSSFIVSDTALVLPPPPNPPDMVNLLRPKTSTIHAYPTSSAPNTTTIPPKFALILAFAGAVGLGTLMMAAAILLARGCPAMPSNAGNLLSKLSQQLPAAPHDEPNGIEAQITGYTTNLHHDEISATTRGCLACGLGHTVIHHDDQNTQLLYDNCSHHTRAPSVPALRTKPSLEVGSLHAMVSS